MLSHVGVGFQGSFGTANVDSFHYIPIHNETLTEAKPPLVDESMRGRFEAGVTYEGFNEITGDIVFPPHPILLGVALKAWFGQSSGSAQDDSYLHSFIPRTQDFDALAAVPPMTIEVYRDAGSAHQYYDVCCNALSIEIAHGAIYRATMSVIGGKYSKVVKSTPSYIVGDDFTWDQSSVSLNGSAVDEISTLTISFNNNLEAKGTLDGTKTANRIKRTTFRTIEVSGTSLYVDDTELDIFRAGTEQRAAFNIDGGYEVASGYNATLLIDIPSARYNEYPPQVGGTGLNEVSFTMDAKYNAGSGTMAELQLVNSQPSY